MLRTQDPPPHVNVTAGIIEVAVFWMVTLCHLLDGYQSLGGASSIHLPLIHSWPQGPQISQSTSPYTV